jgi:hypothetical protein
LANVNISVNGRVVLVKGCRLPRNTRLITILEFILENVHLFVCFRDVTRNLLAKMGFQLIQRRTRVSSHSCAHTRDAESHIIIQDLLKSTKSLMFFKSTKILMLVQKSYHLRILGMVKVWNRVQIEFIICSQSTILKAPFLLCSFRNNNIRFAIKF